MRVTLRSLRSVVGIGLTRHGDDMAVKVNLSAPTRRKLPQDVDGVPVVYEVVGAIRKAAP